MRLRAEQCTEYIDYPEPTKINSGFVVPTPKRHLQEKNAKHNRTIIEKNPKHIENTCKWTEIDGLKKEKT